MKNISIIIIGAVISFQTVAQNKNEPAKNLSLKEAIERFSSSFANYPLIAG